MKTLTPEHFTKVTPAMAQDWLAHNNYSQQRALKQWWVKYLATEMKRGWFREGTQIDFCVLDQWPWLVNGQHTLSAIVETGRSIALMVVFRPVTSWEEIEQQYATHGRDLPRSLVTVLKGLGLAEKFNMSVKNLELFSSAVRYPENNFVKATYNTNTDMHRNAVAIAQAMERWHGPASFYFQLIAPASQFTSRFLHSTAVMALALATLNVKDQGVVAEAEEFWQGIAHNDGLRSGDPRKALIEFFSSIMGVRAPNPMIKIRAAANAWNAWHDKRSLEIVRVPASTQIGVTIRGTEFVARRALTVRRDAAGEEARA